MSGFASSRTALANAIHNSDSSLILGVKTGIRGDLVFHRPTGLDETGTSGNDTMNGTTSGYVLGQATNDNTMLLIIIAA